MSNIVWVFVLHALKGNVLILIPDRQGFFMFYSGLQILEKAHFTKMIFYPIRHCVYSCNWIALLIRYLQLSFLVWFWIQKILFSGFQFSLALICKRGSTHLVHVNIYIESAVAWVLMVH